MTIASLKRKWPSLIRRAEKSMRLKFKRKPALKISPGGRPRDECKLTCRGYGKRKKVVAVPFSRVIIPRRMARDNPTVAEVAALHELRETLAFQNGYAPKKAHARAKRMEKGDVKRLKLGKSGGWLLREHYRWGKKPRFLW